MGPIGATLRLKVNKSDLPDPRVPKHDAALDLSRVAVSLSKDQYRCTLYPKPIPLNPKL